MDIVFYGFVGFNISALIVLLLIFYVFFFGKRTLGRYVGGLYNQCDTMHLYIVTETKLEYIVT